MSGDIEMEDSAAVMCQHQEHIENLEPNRWDRKEIDRHHRLDVVVEEGTPSLEGRLAESDHVVISKNSICLISIRVAGSTSSPRRQVTSGYIGRNSALKAPVQRQADQNQ